MGARLPNIYSGYKLVIPKRLTETEKLTLDFKTQFSDKFTATMTKANYQIVLTSLNPVDPTVELTKRIDLTADKNCVQTNVLMFSMTTNQVY